MNIDNCRLTEEEWDALAQQEDDTGIIPDIDMEIIKKTARKIFEYIEKYDGSYTDKRFWRSTFWQKFKKGLLDG